MKTLLSIVAFALLLVTSAHAQDWAKAKLERSPRHQEWIKVKQGKRDILLRGQENLYCIAE